VAAPLALAIVFVGDAALAGLLAVASAIAAWELFRMAKAAGHAPFSDLGCALAGLFPLAVHAVYLGLIQPRITYLAIILIALLSISVWARGASGRPLGAVAITVLGVLYTGGLLSFGYALRYHDYAVGAAAGTVLVMLPVFLTWATDVGAYVFGRTFGRKKLIPSVSPGKTVEGAVGGLGLTIVMCLLYVRFILMPYAQLGLTFQGAVLFAIVVSVAAQTGDLAESLLKREAGIKDSSRIIPGHGGILDRFDSLLFVMPVAFLLLGRLLLPYPQ